MEIKYKGLTITEAEREFTKDFPKIGSFTFRIPLPIEKARIIAITTRLLGGMPLESITPGDYEYVRTLSVLDFVTVKKPDGWSSFSECPDDDFIKEAWKAYLESERKFDDYIKKN